MLTGRDNKGLVRSQGLCLCCGLDHFRSMCCTSGLSSLVERKYAWGYLFAWSYHLKMKRLTVLLNRLICEYWILVCVFHERISLPEELTYAKISELRIKLKRCCRNIHSTVHKAMTSFYCNNRKMVLSELKQYIWLFLYWGSFWEQSCGSQLTQYLASAHMTKMEMSCHIMDISKTSKTFVSKPFSYFFQICICHFRMRSRNSAVIY